MPIGKGYFWEGLAKGVQGLYGQTVNERLAKNAQDFSAGEAVKDRAGRLAQIDAATPRPTPDTLNPDADTAARMLADTRRAKAQHEGDIMGKSQNPAKWAQDGKRLSDEEMRLTSLTKGMGSKLAQRQGVDVVAPRPAPSGGGLMDQFKAFKAAKGRGNK